MCVAALGVAGLVAGLAGTGITMMGQSAAASAASQAAQMSSMSSMMQMATYSEQSSMYATESTYAKEDAQTNLKNAETSAAYTKDAGEYDADRLLAQAARVSSPPQPQSPAASSPGTVTVTAS